MISADHFHDNGDGTAWVVTHDCLASEWCSHNTRPCSRDMTDLDRPCGGCNGSRYDRALAPCPDCIDGRHTFTIEVEWCNPDLIGAWESKTYRVSIVPGMVLPIVKRHPFGPFTYADGYVLAIGQVWQSPAEVDGANITLPPAAKPGMYAVKLKMTDA